MDLSLSLTKKSWLPGKLNNNKKQMKNGSTGVLWAMQNANFALLSNGYKWMNDQTYTETNSFLDYLGIFIDMLCWSSLKLDVQRQKNCNSKVPRVVLYIFILFIFHCLKCLNNVIIPGMLPFPLCLASGISHDYLLFE